MQIFHRKHGVLEGKQSWTEREFVEPRNYQQTKEKDLGVLELSQKDIAKKKPVDTIIADVAINRLQELEGKQEPFFLAVGFRYLSKISKHVQSEKLKA